MQIYKEQYYNGVERMNSELENKIKSNTTDVSKNPAFPSVDKDGNPINFIELLAYKRFKKGETFYRYARHIGRNGVQQTST